MSVTPLNMGSQADAARTMSQMNTAFARQAEEYLNLCASSLAFCNEIAESWRQCMAASATASEEVLHKLNGSRNMGDLIGAYNEWLRKNAAVYGEEAGKMPQRVSALGDRVIDTAEHMRQEMETWSARPAAVVMHQPATRVAAE